MYILFYFILLYYIMNNFKLYTILNRVNIQTHDEKIHNSYFNHKDDNNATHSSKNLQRVKDNKIYLLSHPKLYKNSFFYSL